MPDVASRQRSFAELFGQAPTVAADAPGRVNLIGEHTDYHDGFVLPCAIPQRTWVELRPRPDDRVRLWSSDQADDIVEYTVGAESKRDLWIDYVAGLTKVLGERGLHVGGFDLRVDSTVPVGAGLSSSAALEVAVLRALREAFTLPLDDVTLARVGQAAEVGFVGAPVGIMDQMAASLATEREALFIDTRTLEHTRVPLPPSIELIVINSGIVHRHAGGGYAQRRAESEEAARLLGVKALRDADVSALERLTLLPEIPARRARHVITENIRVLQAVDALRGGDAARLGALFAASHASMRDDYEVSVPDVDTLVEIGRRDPDVFGARLTGGGFGGAVVMLARAGTARDAAARIAAAYRSATSHEGRVLVPAAS